mgnify:CR=1 FL=1
MLSISSSGDRGAIPWKEDREKIHMSCMDMCAVLCCAECTAAMV